MRELATYGRIVAAVDFARAKQELAPESAAASRDSRERHSQRLLEYELEALDRPSARDACFGAANARLLASADALDRQIQDASGAGDSFSDSSDLFRAMKLRLNTLRLARQLWALELLAENAEQRLGVEPLRPRAALSDLATAGVNGCEKTS